MEQLKRSEHRAMTDMKKTLSEAASHGRYGDNKLLHVSEAELTGLASLVPGGKLPRNPKTGLPEAFFFLPFLTGLLGAAAAPAAAAATAIPAAAAAASGAAGLGALGAGLTAGMTAATSALPAAAGAAASALPAAAASAVPALATAAPELAAMGAGAAAPMAGGGGLSSLLGMGGSGLPSAAAAAPSTAAIPSAAGLPGLTINGPLANTTAGFSSMSGAGTTPVVAAPEIGANPLLGSTPMTSVPESALTTGTGDFLPHAARLDAAPAANAAPPSVPTVYQDAPMAGAKPVDPSAYPAAPAEPQGGLGGLMNRIGIGGAGRGIGGTGIGLNELAMMSMMMPKGGGGGGEEDDEGGDIDSEYKGGDPSTPDSGYTPGRDAEFDYFPNENYRRFSMGGKVRKYAGGGIVDLAPQQAPPPAPVQGAPPAAPQGIESLMQQGSGPEPIPESPFPKSQVGTESEGDKALIAETVAAIKGQSPNPDQVIMAFIQTFGEQALQDLVARVRSTNPQQGAPVGDGMSDSVPATINGSEPAALSHGEFVVPADVVSGLGNGSSDAGANHLYGMMDRVRKMRTGGTVQPKAINPMKAMPV